MNPTVSRLSSAVLSAVILLVGLSGTAIPPVASAEAPKPASCAAAEYRQFDFWIGDWDVFDMDGGGKAAHLRVDRLLNGCVLREQYEDESGLHGQSLSLYDASRNLWHQSWVTNRGRLLVIEGKLQVDEMILAGRYESASGEETLVRGIWKPMSGNVRETAVTSTDDGKTWKPWFDLELRRER